jgi:hypothetical protein
VGDPGETGRSVLEYGERRGLVAGYDDGQLQAGRAGVDDEDRPVGQCGQTQSRISGASSPYSRV